MKKLSANETAGQLSAAFYTVDFWHSLRYFNLYRLVLASLFVFLSGTFGSQLPLGNYSWALFFYGSLFYALVVTLSFITIQLRWPRFNWQLAIQVGGDIVALTVLSYASSGIQSGIGLLLLVSLAAAGMVSRGKIPLFFAALASIAALLEHSYLVLTSDTEPAQYVQVGLLCMAYFAVAWLAHTLARHAIDSQRLAQSRGDDLASLSEANRLVMRDMQDGVLVVDEQGVVTQINTAAERLLRKNVVDREYLSIFSPVLFGQYALWKQTGRISRDILQLGGGAQARLRFVAIDRDAVRGVVIFLEDMQRVQSEAQQIKLAALGRLTANIAHEVRNPLSAISYAIELLREELVEANQLRLSQIVLDNAHRINQIIQDVMQLNRRDRSRPVKFELDEMLHAFIREFCLAERVDEQVVVLAGMPAVAVDVDPGHLRQVLWNLCRNALRHGKKMPGSLLLSVLVKEGRTMLMVQDDGPGISSEHQGKLFEPFFTTATEGTGLGLYIAKELCEANGALLEYRGDGRRVGACFCITFGDMSGTTREN